jgi:predicted DNA-binding transcriptional regulator YafY
MGQRSPTETLVRIFQAFLRQREWNQARLAEEVGVSAKAVRERLDELRIYGVPLTREEAPSSQVVWRVAEGWFPGSLKIPRGEVSTLLRLVLLAAEGDDRRRMLELLMGAVSPAEAFPSPEAVVVTPTRTEAESRHLQLVLDARLQARPLALWYQSAQQSAPSRRLISVQRVVPGASLRFVGWCHDGEELRWYRVDRIDRGHLDHAEPYHEVADDTVDRWIADSVHGFRQSTPVACGFTVRAEEARWVRANLPDVERMPNLYTIETLDDGGLRVHRVTSAVHMLARYVVGLGDAARAETPELADEVRRLARGSLANH